MEHRSLLHWRLFFRPNLHVPLIVRVPGQPPGVVDDVVGLIDVVPTVLDLLGVPPLATATGRSLRPHLDGAPVEAGAVYAEPFAPDMEDRSLVTATHQLLQLGSAPRPLLFDLRRDPFSQRNVRGTRRKLARHLGAALAARRAAVEEAARSEQPSGRVAPSIAPRVRRELEALGYVE
jgi:arylsulfatase A-like enzyme